MCLNPLSYAYSKQSGNNMCLMMSQMHKAPFPSLWHQVPSPSRGDCSSPYQKTENETLYIVFVFFIIVKSGKTNSVRILIHLYSDTSG